MPFEIIRNDITKVQADAIVNTANPYPVPGAGVDSAIYSAAGWDLLLAERKKIGEMRPGEAMATPAFDLHSQFIIHTVGPAWEGGKNGEVETVAQCYRNSLTLAGELGAESIAFPLISAGTLGFPKHIALETALSEINKFLMECDQDMTVYLVVYNKEAFELSEKLVRDVKSYIEESEVKLREEQDHIYGMPLSRDLNAHRAMMNRPEKLSDDEELTDSALFDEEGMYESVKDSRPEILGDMSWGPEKEDLGGPLSEEESIDEIIKNRRETFQEHLFRLIDRKDLDDVVVYKKANVDRKLFSKIKSNPEYTPSKKTAIAFAIALELNLDETMDLIGRAGYALSKSSVSDLIIEYCIKHQIFDIYTVNCLLFDQGQATLS